MITIGFYICKTSKVPSFMEGITDCFVSASDCLIDHEPQIMLCHDWKTRGDDEEYIKCFPSRDIYIKMSAEITKLQGDGLFDHGGRFLRKEDALYFYNEYFNDADHMLISVSTEAEFMPYLEEITIYDDQCAGDDFLGHEIIGWDYLGFHSFFCNKLQDEFPDIRYTRKGLIDADFDTVAKMADKIQGMGEPVDWVPVAIHRVLIES